MVVTVYDIVAVSSILWFYCQDVHELSYNIQDASIGSGATVWELHKVTSILYYNHEVQTSCG